MSHDNTIKSRFVPMASIFIVLAGAAMGGIVQAAEPEYDRTTVAYGDLNLDSQQGAKALYARLRNGAKDVCYSFEGRDSFFKRVWRTCVDQAMATAVAQVNTPRLTTLHNQTINRSKGDR
jgi:UrcA family protein